MNEVEVRALARRTAAEWLEGDLDSFERPESIEGNETRENIFRDEIEGIISALREGRFVVRRTR